MFGPSDKAQIYLERAVPQLQEFKSKKIFTQEEIISLVKKRSDFEHKLVSRGCRPTNFARYAVWEIGLDKLRRKRCKRLGIKCSMSNGQAKILNIFDRGTKKYPGDLALWISYLDYLKVSKASKRLKAVLTAAIRLHPTKLELWLYGARWSLESQVDINGARNFMQRGARFCPNSSELWIEYAKLEMIYLSKIELRRKILLIDDTNANASTTDSNLNHEQSFSNEQDIFPISVTSVETLQPSMVEANDIDVDAPKDLITTPALNGAIPLAIFDFAQKKPFFCASIAAKFFNMFTSFPEVRCLPRILQHITKSMMESYPHDPLSWNCYTMQPLIGKNHLHPEFPSALGIALQRITESLESLEVVKDRGEYGNLSKTWINRILDYEELDPGLKTVLQNALRKFDLIA